MMDNCIKYVKIDGCPSSYDCKNGLMTMYHEVIFSSETIEIWTDQILFIGDIVNIEDRELKVQERIYYPKDNHFVFFCNPVYTGRRA